MRTPRAVMGVIVILIASVDSGSFLNSRSSAVCWKYLIMPGPVGVSNDTKIEV
ncbi:MAG: hypothetical protein HRK26_00930 [Rickettsiaceae bacterium H1]|nr:hypothetical protein [Rickettsiaceae bacterium H1]